MVNMIGISKFSYVEACLRSVLLNQNSNEKLFFWIAWKHRERRDLSILQKWKTGLAENFPKLGSPKLPILHMIVPWPYGTRCLRWLIAEDTDTHISFNRQEIDLEMHSWTAWRSWYGDASALDLIQLIRETMVWFNAGHMLLFKVGWRICIKTSGC